MFKLLKYELKGRKKVMLGGAAAIIIANLLLMLDYKLQNGDASQFGAIMMLVIFAMGVAACVLIIIDSINILKKDLFEDTGSMLFMVPQSSFSILGSKILTTIIECLIFGGLYTLFAVFHAHNLTPDSLLKVFDNNVANNMDIIATVILAIFTSLITFLSTIYFSLVLAKSMLKNNKYAGGLTFGIVILINIPITKLNRVISKYLPDIKMIDHELNISNLTMEMKFAMANQGIWAIIFNLCVFIILFISTGYLLEHKTDI